MCRARRRLAAVLAVLIIMSVGSTGGVAAQPAVLEGHEVCSAQQFDTLDLGRVWTTHGRQWGSVLTVTNDQAAETVVTFRFFPQGKGQKGAQLVMWVPGGSTGTIYPWMFFPENRHFNIEVISDGVVCVSVSYERLS